MPDIYHACSSRHWSRRPRLSPPYSRCRRYLFAINARQDIDVVAADATALYVFHAIIHIEAPAVFTIF